MGWDSRILLRPKLKMKSGFTLTEVLIVVIIIGILASLGLPQFYKTIGKALTKEAIANLKLIAAAEKVYRMEIGGYYPQNPPEGDIADINSYLRLYFTNETNWDYTITTAAPNTFTATADRTGTGTYSTCIYTLTHNDADGEPNKSGTCP